MLRDIDNSCSSLKSCTKRLGESTEDVGLGSKEPGEPSERAPKPSTSPSTISSIRGVPAQEMWSFREALGREASRWALFNVSGEGAAEGRCSGCLLLGVAGLDGGECLFLRRDVDTIVADWSLKEELFSQSRPFLRQGVHTGSFSSHFFFRLRQVRHPVFVLSALLRGGCCKCCATSIPETFSSVVKVACNDELRNHSTLSDFHLEPGLCQEVD